MACGTQTKSFRTHWPQGIDWQPCLGGAGGSGVGHNSKDLSVMATLPIRDNGQCETVVPCSANATASLHSGSINGSEQGCPCNSENVKRRLRRQRQKQKRQVCQDSSGNGGHLPTAAQHNGPAAASQPLVGRRVRHRNMAGDAEVDQSAKLSAAIEAGGETRSKAIAGLRNSILQLSFDSTGCRIVQDAIEFGEPIVAAELAAELRGHVWEAIYSPHANFVVQKIIVMLPPEKAKFVVEELQGKGATLARHIYGCRVFCRLIEHNSAAVLIREALVATSELSRHVYGHHVMESILEHGSREERAQIINALCKNLMQNVKSRNAIYVIVSTVTYASMEELQALVAALLADPCTLASLTQTHSGCHILRTLVRSPDQALRKMLMDLQLSTDQIQVTKYGQRLIQELSQNDAVTAAAAA